MFQVGDDGEREEVRFQRATDVGDGGGSCFTNVPRLFWKAHSEEMPRAPRLRLPSSTAAPQSKRRAGQSLRAPRRAICSDPCHHALSRSMLRRWSNHHSPRGRTCREQRRQRAGPSAGSSAKGNCNLRSARRPAGGVGQETVGLHQLRTRSEEEISAAAIHRAVSGLALPLSA